MNLSTLLLLMHLWFVLCVPKRRDFLINLVGNDSRGQQSVMVNTSPKPMKLRSDNNSVNPNTSVTLRFPRITRTLFVLMKPMTHFASGALSGRGSPVC